MNCTKIGLDLTGGKNIKEKVPIPDSDYDTLKVIRHIAITNCPFRFAFSRIPRCGQLLRQKNRKNLTCNLCARFS